jgi:hypothetical protein
MFIYLYIVSLKRALDRFVQHNLPAFVAPTNATNITQLLECGGQVGLRRAQCGAPSDKKSAKFPNATHLLPSKSHVRLVSILLWPTQRTPVAPVLSPITGSTFSGHAWSGVETRQIALISSTGVGCQLINNIEKTDIWKKYRLSRPCPGVNN